MVEKRNLRGETSCYYSDNRRIFEEKFLNFDREKVHDITIIDSWLKEMFFKNFFL